MVIQVYINLYNDYFFHFNLLYILVQLSLKNQYLFKNVAPGSEDYKVEQLHFHWGHSNDNINGSEHLHEGQSYPLEVNIRNLSYHFYFLFFFKMHIVSYSSWYSSLGDAMTNTRGLAVVGIFFEVKFHLFFLIVKIFLLIFRLLMNLIHYFNH